MARTLRTGMFIGGTLIVSAATAQQAQRSEPFFRDLAVETRILSQELVEETIREAITLNAQPVIQQLSQLTIPLNENFVEVVSLEAATIKADKTRVAVQPDKILVATQPNAPTLGFFYADVRTRTILFPDVVPGDTIEYRLVIRQKRPVLAGGVSQVRVALPSMRFRSFVWTIDAPESVTVQTGVRGFSQTSAREGGRLRQTYTLEPLAFQAEEPQSVAAVDRVPVVRMSTHASKEAIARAFYDGAAPKAEPTPAIRALAEEITRGIPDRREQARAIYEHVSKTIRYMAILLGNGGWVPHEAEEVLRLKYGDCKDHVTLMRALLTARGIPADYALINVAPVYKEAATPVYAYDHVILYLPEFDLYTDPTSTYSSFDVLPQSEADKEVLRVGPQGVVATRSPRLDAAGNRLSLSTEVTLRDNGSPVGRTVAEASGPIARDLRALAADAAKAGTAEFANNRLKARRWRGTGDIIAPAPTDHSDPFRLTATFDLQNRYFGGGNNPNVLPAGPNLIEPFASRVRTYLRESRRQDFPCSSQTYEHRFAIKLPEGKALAAVPANVETVTDLARYSATYRLEGGTLHVERRFVSTLPGQSCTAEMARAMQPAVQAYGRDIGMRLKFAGESADKDGDDGDQQ